MYSSNKFYTMALITERVLYIEWHQVPKIDSPTENQFLDQLEDFLSIHQGKTIVLLSNLNNGYIQGRSALKRLSKIAAHEKVITGVAYTKNPIAGLYVDTYRVRSERRIQNKPEANEASFTLVDALLYIDEVEGELTDGINHQSPDKQFEQLVRHAKNQYQTREKIGQV